MPFEKKTNTELRKFAWVMTVAFGIIGLLAWWRGKETAYLWLLGIAAFFLLAGLIVPRLLAPIELVWMKFAHYLSIVMTYVILTLTYYLVITPVGLLLRIMRKDLLSLKFEKGLPSYWVKAEPDGAQTRPDKPF